MKVKYYIKKYIEEYAQKEERSFTWIAKQLKMSKQSLHYFLNKNKYTIEEIAKIAVFLSMRVEDLYNVDI